MMGKRTDEDIILRDGSRVPFESFFKKGFPKFFAFAGRFLSEPFAQEDIVQEAYIEVWNRRDNHFEDELSLEGYMYTFVKNRCIDLLRHLKGKEEFSSREVQTKASDEFLLQSIIDEESRFLVHDAVRRLAPQCRKVMQLHLAGKRIREIAEEMGISEATVKFHKASAFRQLYKSLRPLLLKIITMRKKL